MRSTIHVFPLAIIMTIGCGQYYGQGAYCNLSTASEVFPILTTQLYPCLCKCNAIVFIT